MKNGWKTIRTFTVWCLSLLLVVGLWPSPASAMESGHRTQTPVDNAPVAAAAVPTILPDAALAATTASTQTGSLKMVVRVLGILPEAQTKGQVYTLVLRAVDDDGNRSLVRNHPAVDGGVGTDANGYFTVVGSGNKETSVWIKGLPYGKYNIGYLDSDRSIRGYIGVWLGNTVKEISNTTPAVTFIREITYEILHGITLSASVSGVEWNEQTYSYKVEQRPTSNIPGVMDPVWVTLDKENPTWNNIDFRSDVSYIVTIMLDNVDIPGYKRTTTYMFNGGTPVLASTDQNIVLTGVSMSKSNIAVHHAYTPQFARLRLYVQNQDAASRDSFAMTVAFDNLPADYSLNNVAAGSATIMRKDATFSLSSLTAGQIVTFDGLPVGTTYTVTQTPDNAYATQYATAISGLDGGDPVWNTPLPGNTVKTLSPSGMQAGTTENIQFINAPKWGTVLLTASFADAAKPAEALAADGTVGLTLVNNKTGQIHNADISLKAGRGSVAISLPAGSYTVAQASRPDSLSMAGVSFTWQAVVFSSTQVDITQEKQATVSVENRYDRTTFSFTLDCVVSGDLTADDVDVFYYRITGPAGFQPVTVALTAQNPVWRSGSVPVGTYTVTQLTEKTDSPGYTVDRERYTRVTSYNTGTGFTEGLSATVNAADETATVSFRNHYTRDTGALTLYRDATLGADKQFDYTITFSPPLPKTGVELSVPGFLSADGSSVTFTLKASDAYDSATITGIPTGTRFEIKQVIYTVSLHALLVENDNGYTVSIYVGKIDEKDQTVSVEAEHFVLLHRLTVEKTIQGSYDGETFTYELLVNGRPWGNQEYTYNGMYGYVTASDGTFTLTGGQSAVFEIPQDAHYQVTERPHSDYTSSAVNASGTMTGDVVASFTGSKIPTVPIVPTGPALQISFRVEGSAAGEVKAPITFIVQRGVNKVALCTYDIYKDGVIIGSGVTDSLGVFSLQAGETAKFYGLPTGIYTVSCVSTTDFLGLNTQAVTLPVIYAQAKIFQSTSADILFDFVGQIEYKATTQKN